VKQLADQTAKATDQIGRQIGEIQTATTSTVEAITRIVRTVDSIQQASEAITGAVETQRAATDEIAANTLRAADGTANVTANIAAVSNAAAMTGATSEQLLSLSSALSGRSRTLQADVSSFVATLRLA
jgi:methyl-accepting chemotaxis protein